MILLTFGTLLSPKAPLCCSLYLDKRLYKFGHTIYLCPLYKLKGAGRLSGHSLLPFLVPESKTPSANYNSQSPLWGNPETGSFYGGHVEVPTCPAAVAHFLQVLFWVVKRQIICCPPPPRPRSRDSDPRGEKSGLQVQGLALSIISPHSVCYILALAKHGGANRGRFLV